MSKTRGLSVLLVDDEDIIHRTLGDYLAESGHRVESVRSGDAALAALAVRDYDLALLDVQMPGMDGLTLLGRMVDLRPETAAVIMTGHGNLEMAVQALRLGAADFLAKPVKLLELDAVIEKAARLHALRRDRRRLRETLREIQSAETSRLLGVSPAMQTARRQLETAVAARVDSILILGETGVGKEVAAREIHRLAGGEDRPFIAVSCPAIPDTLIESELFGHVKGAFTGAVENQTGCFELADGGTLFLDEVGDLSPPAQAKLLRVLETRAFRRVGGNDEITVDLRLVAATNADLEQAVARGKFRQDLLYRLNLFTVRLEPLRDRPEDVLPLANYFLEQYTTRRGLAPQQFSPAAEKLLLAYSYPGNARELRNLVERAAILCRGPAIGPEFFHLPTPQGGAASVPANDPEKQKILQALEAAQWNRREAAQLLNMPYSTLRYKIKTLGLG